MALYETRSLPVCSFTCSKDTVPGHDSQSLQQGAYSELTRSCFLQHKSSFFPSTSLKTCRNFYQLASLPYPRCQNSLWSGCRVFCHWEGSTCHLVAHRTGMRQESILVKLRFGISWGSHTNTQHPLPSAPGCKWHKCKSQVLFHLRSLLLFLAEGMCLPWKPTCTVHSMYLPLPPFWTTPVLFRPVFVTLVCETLAAK